MSPSPFPSTVTITRWELSYNYTHTHTHTHTHTGTHTHTHTHIIIVQYDDIYIYIIALVTTMINHRKIAKSFRLPFVTLNTQGMTISAIAKEVNRFKCVISRILKLYDATVSWESNSPVILVGNGIGDPSSNHRRGCLCFTSHKCIFLFPPAMWKY